MYYIAYYIIFIMYRNICIFHFVHKYTNNNEFIFRISHAVELLLITGHRLQTDSDDINDYDSIFIA